MRPRDLETASRETGHPLCRHNNVIPKVSNAGKMPTKGESRRKKFQPKLPPIARIPILRAAMAAGGGLDLNLGPHLSVRVFKADYFFTHFLNGTNDRQNNMRLTFWRVFHFSSE